LTVRRAKLGAREHPLAAGNEERPSMRTSVSARELRAMFEDGEELALLDAREEGAYALSHILYASNVPVVPQLVRMFCAPYSSMGSLAARGWPMWRARPSGAICGRRFPSPSVPKSNIYSCYVR